jgi:hypothetical protein
MLLLSDEPQMERPREEREDEVRNQLFPDADWNYWKKR